MRFVVVWITLLLLPLSAKPTPLADLPLSELIATIKQHNTPDRRLAINQLKLRLRTLNTASRTKVMKELQMAWHTQGSTTPHTNATPKHLRANTPRHLHPHDAPLHLRHREQRGK